MGAGSLSRHFGMRCSKMGCRPPTPEEIFHTFWDRGVQGCNVNLQNVYNPGLLLDERSTSSQKGYPWSKTVNYLYAFCCCCCRCAVGVVHGTGDES
jgi:hypothetical protein